jgi:hypothetical protein
MVSSAKITKFRPLKKPGQPHIEKVLFDDKPYIFTSCRPKIKFFKKLFKICLSLKDGIPSGNLRKFRRNFFSKFTKYSATEFVIKN